MSSARLGLFFTFSKIGQVNKKKENDNQWLTVALSGPCPIMDSQAYLCLPTPVYHCISSFKYLDMFHINIIVETLTEATVVSPKLVTWIYDKFPFIVSSDFLCFITRHEQ